MKRDTDSNRFVFQWTAGEAVLKQQSFNSNRSWISHWQSPGFIKKHDILISFDCAKFEYKSSLILYRSSKGENQNSLDTFGMWHNAHSIYLPAVNLGCAVLLHGVCDFAKSYLKDCGDATKINPAKQLNTSLILTTHYTWMPQWYSAEVSAAPYRGDTMIGTVRKKAQDHF